MERPVGADRGESPVSWAERYIEALELGQRVNFRPRGRSMEPKIRDGQLCTVRPLLPTEVPAVGSVVLCRVGGRDFLHFVKAHRKLDVRPGHGVEYLIGNNRGGTNGWVGRSDIHGVLVGVED